MDQYLIHLRNFGLEAGELKVFLGDVTFDGNKSLQLMEFILNG